MSSKSFDRFYFIEDDNLHDLEEIQIEYTHRKGNINRYRGKIYCPECKEAKLSFTHQTKLRRAYLSTLPTSQHREDCSYFYDYASEKELSTYFKSLTYERIEGLLESALNRLIERPKSSDLKQDVSTRDNPLTFSLVNERSKVNVIKAIPRKSLNSWFDQQELDQCYIFYGKVKLKEERKVSKENRTFYKILIFTKQKGGNWIYKTNFLRSQPINPNENTIYTIAILGKVNFYNGFPQIKPYESQKPILIKYRTLQTID